MNRAWLRIQEPRVIRTLYWFGYATALIGGASTLARPAVAIEDVWGPVLGMSWSVFWLIGGLAGMSSCLTGWWQVERTAIGMILTGIAIFALVVIYMYFARGNSPSSLITVTFAALLFIVRLVMIRGHDYEPRG